MSFSLTKRDRKSKFNLLRTLRMRDDELIYNGKLAVAM